MGVLVDAVTVSLLVLFALVLVMSVVRSATAAPRRRKRVPGGSGDTSWAVFSSDGGSDCGSGGGDGGCS
jgi:hypothetical protein